eukprot:10575-Heterococcus_DN1.PRE.1
MSQHTDELQLHVQQHVMYLFCETHLYVHHGRKRTLAALTNAHCNCHYSNSRVVLNIAERSATTATVATADYASYGETYLAVIQHTHHFASHSKLYAS